MEESKKKRKVRERKEAPEVDESAADRVAVGERNKNVAERERGFDTVLVGERNKGKRQFDNQQMAALAIMLELYRITNAVSSQKLPLDKPQDIPVPQEITNEAFRMGARGRSLELQTIAVVTYREVQRTYGAGAADDLGKAILRAVALGMAATAGGLFFNSRARMAELFRGPIFRDMRDEEQKGLFGADHDFQGILG